MAKKKFSSGLDDLFSDNAVAAPAHFGGAVSEVVVVAPRQGERRVTHKNFLLGLDALLQEAMEESLDNYERNGPMASAEATKTRSILADQRGDSLGNGLDALIRQTIEVQDMPPDETTGKRRLVVSVDKPRLDKLKTIARLENAFLKDLLVNVIDGYIYEYTRDKGLDI
jgi:hypothetical protein